MTDPVNTMSSVKKTKPKSTGDEASVDIDTELCKGCEFCVDVCPEECLSMAEMINTRGYHFAQYGGDDCTGCGICFYNCPEPAAITVYKAPPKKKETTRG